MVNPYAIMPYHAIKPQFWRDFYHFIPISGDYLAVFCNIYHINRADQAMAAQEVSLFRGFTAMRLDSWPTIIPSARKMPYGCVWKWNSGWWFWATYPSEKSWSEFVSWDDVPFPTEWNKIVPKHQDAWWFPDIYGTLGNIGPIDPSQRTPESSHESAYHGNSWEFMGIHGIPYGYFDVHQGYHGFWHTAISKNKIHPQNHSYNPPSLKLHLAPSTRDPSSISTPTHLHGRRSTAPRRRGLSVLLGSKNRQRLWRFTSSGWSSWYKMNIPSIVGQYLDKMVILG